MRETKKDKPLFPPAQTPRKIDLQMESGEYFLKGRDKKGRERDEKEVARQEKKREREEERKKDFIPPIEEVSRKKVRNVEKDGVVKKMKKMEAGGKELVDKKKKRKRVEEEEKLEKKKRKKKVSEE